MASRVRVISNRIDGISDAVKQAVEDELVLEVAESVAETAARNSPRRTGFLKMSWKAEKAGDSRAVAYSDANLAHIYEYGAAGANIPAQPMATPAAEEEQAKAGRKAAAAVKKAAK